MKKLKFKKLFKDLNDKKAGSIIEYGLIIGFSLIAFLMIISIIMAILNWDKNALDNFFKTIIK